MKITEKEIEAVMNALAGTPTVTTPEFADKIEKKLRSHSKENQIKIFGYKQNSGKYMDYGIICGVVIAESESEAKEILGYDNWEEFLQKRNGCPLLCVSDVPNFDFNNFD